MAQEHKWTPGPWGVSEWAHTGVEDRKRRNICSTGGYSDNRDTVKTNEQNIANAHLIAAAPELYEALDALKDYFCGPEEVLEKIHAALAKARGEQC